MQKSLIILVLALIPFLSYGQRPSIQKFYDQYKDLENVSTVKLQGWLLNLVASNDENPETDDLTQKITNLRVLIMEESNLVSKKDYKQLKKSVRKDEFEDLFQIRDGKEVIEFMIREDGEAITDVLILVNGVDNFVMLSLEGRLRFSDLNDLDIQVEGGDHLKKIPEKKGQQPRA